MTNSMIIIAIIAYLAFVVVVGVSVSKKNKSTDDFYLGGRKLGPFVTAMSAEASDMSSWLLMGLPGVALATGLADAFWTAIGLFLGTYLNWLIVAKKLRRYSEKTNSNTIPDFFSNRFRDKSGVILAITAIVIVIFFVPYTASGFAAVGKLFNSLFGFDYHISMIVGAFIIALYTVIGGFLAASTTDFVQSIIMTFALLIVVLFGIENSGGLNNVLTNAVNTPGYISINQIFSNGSAANYGIITIISTLAWGLGYFGMPHILLRFMAISDEKKLKLSRRIASAWVFIAMGIAIFIGIIGKTFIESNGIDLADSERIIIVMAKSISNLDTFAALIAGLILAGILASIMSTADSQMLAAASSVSENIIRRFFFKNMSNKVSMIVARVTVIIVAIIGIVFAWNQNSSVFKIVSFAWAGFGAAFGPVVIGSLFWKRMNKWGALAGMIGGGAMVFIWKFVIRPLGGALDIYELLPAFIVSAILIIIVSLITPKPSKEIIEEFESIKSK